MAEEDYVRLADACHCGRPAKVSLGRGRPPKQCEEHLAAQARAPRPYEPKTRAAACERCAQQIKCGKGGRAPRLCAACKRPQKEQKQCPACQGIFVPKDSRQQCCTRACGRAWRRGAFKPEQRQCDHCGTSYTAIRKEAMYCGQRCKRVAWMAANPDKVAAWVVRRREANAPTLCAYHAGYCLGCGKPHGSRQPWKRCPGCTRERQLEVARQAARAMEIAKHKARAKEVCCRLCSGIFCPLYGEKHAATCPECEDAFRREARLAQKAKRRNRLRNTARETVVARKVFERDGWRCRMCGTETPETLRGTTEHNAPELDHVVPVARGGAHTYANTQCLCRSCNNLKGAMTMAEAAATFASQ